VDGEDSGVGGDCGVLVLVLLFVLKDDVDAGVAGVEGVGGVPDVCFRLLELELEFEAAGRKKSDIVFIACSDCECQCDCVPWCGVGW